MMEEYEILNIKPFRKFQPKIEEFELRISFTAKEGCWSYLLDSKDLQI